LGVLVVLYVTVEKVEIEKANDLHWFNLFGKELSTNISITAIGTENEIEKIQVDISALPMGTYLLYDSNERVSIVIKH
jgi:hypothetical protein